LIAFFTIHRFYIRAFRKVEQDSEISAGKLDFINVVERVSKDDQESY